ncbi:hypothetical protein [Luteimonas notoginsengisoli]|uniref:Uncharacterized protein n=1 Tax=Luteimonas notoginsengisoli TaxID=1578200 RepID=A0ABV7UQ34_9GAMM
MKQSRAELDARIDALAVETQRLANEDPDSDLIGAFAGVAEEIEADAGDDDHAHVWTRLQCILRDNGLIPGDDEPCQE